MAATIGRGLREGPSAATGLRALYVLHRLVLTTNPREHARINSILQMQKWITEKASNLPSHAAKFTKSSYDIRQLSVALGLRHLDSRASSVTLLEAVKTLC